VTGPVKTWTDVRSLLLSTKMLPMVAGILPLYLLFLAKVCAASLVVSLPVLVAGFAAQDKLVQGLSMGAVK
jgi:polyol transport system permease protein